MKLKKKAALQARLYAVERSRDEETSKRHRDEAINRFQVLQHAHDLEEQWSPLKLSRKVLMLYLAREEDPKQRWISANSWQLIDERKAAKAKRDLARKKRQGWSQGDET